MAGLLCLHLGRQKRFASGAVGQAVGWLRRNRMLLPEVSVLARLVGGVRDGAAGQMHRILAEVAATADPELPSRLLGLLMVPDRQPVAHATQNPRSTGG